MVTGARHVAASQTSSGTSCFHDAVVCRHGLDLPKSPSALWFLVARRGPVGRAVQVGSDGTLGAAFSGPCSPLPIGLMMCSSIRRSWSCPSPMVLPSVWFASDAPVSPTGPAPREMGFGPALGSDSVCCLFRRHSRGGRCAARQGMIDLPPTVGRSRRRNKERTAPNPPSGT